MSRPFNLLVGISGPSSSGKTTLSRLLRDIFNASGKADAFILHGDDFYKTDAEIPVDADGLQDWDCLESLNLQLFKITLSHIIEHGSLPADFESKEDKNAVGPVKTDSNVIKYCETAARTTIVQNTSIGDEKLKIAIIDGFLLFSENMADVRSLFDVKLFLRTDYKTAKTRREVRQGYVTIEGFWADPPGYVDKIVWPNYVKDHAFLFKNGDVDGDLNLEVCQGLGIQVMPRGKYEEDMMQCLKWAFEKICIAIQERFK